MKRALIGCTGFVGSTLARQAAFTDGYHSRNIEDIRGQSYELLVCAGAPAVKWKANREPQEDRDNLLRLMGGLASCRAEKVVLISTVDVYPAPVGVDEDTPIDASGHHAYGTHRYELERFVMEHFEGASVVRLPGLFGEGLKKNFIYDLIHTNCLPLTHRDSEFQFYDMSRLWADLTTVIREGLDVVNLATAPVRAGEIASRALGLTLDEGTEQAPVRYDMRTKYAECFGGSDGYLYAAEETYERLTRFIAAERGRL